MYSEIGHLDIVTGQLRLTCSIRGEQIARSEHWIERAVNRRSSVSILAIVIIVNHFCPSVEIFIVFRLRRLHKVACNSTRWDRLMLRTLHRRCSLSRLSLRPGLSRPSRIVIDAKCWMLRHLIEHGLLVEVELSAWAQRNE